MRILHIIESLEFGGAEKVLIDLANSMVDRCELGVCCVKRTGELESALDRRVRVYCMQKGEGNHIRLPFQIARIIRKGGYDVVHSHTWGVYVESAIAAVIARARVLVHTVHGQYLRYTPGLGSRMKTLGRHALERLLAPAHLKIVTVSDAMQGYIRSEVGIAQSRLMTIHNGIDEAPMPARTRQRSDGVRFVTVGRLATVKNYPMLLRAFARVARTHPACRLQFIGDGPDRFALERLTDELGIASNVCFAGFSKDVDRLLAQCDVFVLSSHYEGISIALLEAMRAGLPAIATRVGGMPEAVVHGETGVLVPADDESAMANAMLQLAADPELRRSMGARGHEHMRREFSIRSVSDKYQALYCG